MAEERFSSYEEALQFITNYEQRTVCKLVIYKKTKDVNKTRVDSSDFKVVWDERQGALPIQFDGVPFVIVGKEERECQNGPNRKKGTKKSCEYMVKPEVENISLSKRSFVNQD